LYFNPLDIPCHFFTRYFDSVSSYLESAVEQSDPGRLGLLVTTLDYLVTIAYVTLLVKAGHSGDRALATPAREAAVVRFCRSVSRTLAALSRFQLTKTANSEFVAFLDLVGAHSPPSVFLAIYAAYLSALSAARPIGLPRLRQPRAPPAFAVRLALVSVRGIATHAAFLDRLRADGPLPDDLAELYAQAFASGDAPLILKTTVVFAEIARLAESAGAAAARIATALFPVFSAAALVRESPALARDRTAAAHFAITVLLMLHTFPPDDWLREFSAFDDDQQVLALDLLRCTFAHLLNDPELPALETRAAELAFLAAVCREKIQYSLVNEVTSRVLAFVRVLLAKLGRFRPPLLLAVIGCIRALLGRHQLRTNFRAVLAALGLVIDAHREQICGGHNRILDEIVALAFELVTRQLQVAKAAGVAIIVHLLFADWATTGCLFVAGFHVDSQFIDHLWELPVYKVEPLRGALDAVLPFVRDFVQTDLACAAELLIRRLTVLSDCICDKALNVIFENQAQVTQLFYTLPLELMHYLALLMQECVRAKMPAIFDIQVRTVCVIWWSLQEAGIEDAMRFDLTGVSMVKAVDLSAYSNEQLKYVFDTGIISVEALVEAIKRAIAIADAVGLAPAAAMLWEVLEAAQ
jgi:hypothetical protein